MAAPNKNPTPFPLPPQIHSFKKNHQQMTRPTTKPAPPPPPPPPPSSSPIELLPTPTLDAERSNLLQRISEEGGFAYVNVSSLAAGGDFRAAEAAREMAWEQLHSGPWHSVLPVWRDAYSMACLHVAAFHLGAGQFREALKVLDMGVIMGGMLLRRDLDSSIERIIIRSKGEKGLDGEGREKGSLCGGETECGSYCGDEAKVRVRFKLQLGNKKFFLCLFLFLV